MKKIKLFLLAICAVTIVSCGGSAYSKAIDIYEDAISAVKDAETRDEVYEIEGKAQKEVQALAEEAMKEEVVPTEDEMSRMMELEKEFRTTKSAKLKELRKKE